MVVDEAYQNLASGKRLVLEAIRWSRNQGALSLRVRSNVKRRQAHAFYMRQGFMEIKSKKFLT
jgi:GNAT superfamily N-acetyltransferase